MTRKTCFIIGNGALPYDLSSCIDKADYVLRFNEPPLPYHGGSNGWSGVKTNCLMLCNSHKPMQQKLASRQFLESPFLHGAQELVLVYHPSIIRRFFKRPLITSRLIHARKRDWTWETIEKLGSLDKKITILSPQFYLQACADLGIEGEDLKKIFPSTGYLGIRYMLQYWGLEQWTITLVGFSWQGWKRHAWQSEENWVRARIREGCLNFIETPVA